MTMPNALVFFVTRLRSFVPFGKIIEGMDVADALYTEYGETAGGGIRAGKQGKLFEEGNEYLKRNFPRLDYIVRARVVKR